MNRMVPPIDKTHLDAYLGLNITEICNNGFTCNEQQHCAHFVAHAIGYDGGYTCQTHMGGDHPAGNLRVHEIFHACPQVGKLEDAPTDRPVLLFITQECFVDLNALQMVRQPKRHMGFFFEGMIYHYSNKVGNKKVIQQSVEEFCKYFENLYGAPQALFYGLFPGESPEHETNPTMDSSQLV